MADVGRRSSAALTAAALALSGCEFSAGAGTQGAQQDAVRTLGREANAAALPCAEGWVRQRDLTLAAAGGGGTADRASVAAAVAAAANACRTAAAFFETARPSPMLNDANAALMRTALASCRTAWTDVATQLTLKAELVRGAAGWSSPAHEAAVNRWGAAMPACGAAWRVATAPLEVTDVTLTTLTLGGGPASAGDATASSTPATADAPELAPAPRGPDGSAGKEPPGGVATAEPEPEPSGKPTDPVDEKP